MAVKHAFTSGKADGSDATLVQPSNWNADHTGTEMGCWNVKDPTYGALGNGSNDDTAEINAAITACNAAGGGEVYLPIGMYMVTGLTLKSGVTLRGAGYYTVIKQIASQNTGVITIASQSPQSAFVGVTNLRIDGNKSNQSEGNECYGIVSGYYGVADALIENVWIHDVLRSSVYLEGPRNRVKNCDIRNSGNTTDPGRTGIVLSGENYARTGGGYGQVIGNHIYECYEYGIKLYVGSEHTVVASNVIVNPHRYGIYVSNSEHVIVADNLVTGSSQSGILIQGETVNSDYCSVVGNVCSANASTGIIVWSNGGTIRNVTVTGNSCEGNTGNGVQFQNAAGCICSDNVVVGNSGDGGIVLMTSPNCTISGNVIRNNGSSGGGVGIYNWTGDSSGCVITGNRIFDDASGYQDYAVESASPSDYWTVVGNDLRGNSVSALSLNGTHNITEHNQT